MSLQPPIPTVLSTASPLSTEQFANLGKLTSQLTPLQQAWVSGYLAACANSATTVTAPVTVTEQLTILVGSQTGNAKSIAEQLATECQQKGIQHRLVNLADYKLSALKNEALVTVVVSTHGEGDAPDDAVPFYKFLFSNKAPKLNNLKFSVLALGDSSYEFFCKTGHDIDQRLAELGAERISDIVECDVDFEDTANTWINTSVELFNKELKTEPASNVAASVSPITSSATLYNRNQPYAAELLTNQKITSRKSNKDVRHIELKIDESSIQYQPGDALGVWFNNDPELAKTILALLSIDEQQAVEWQGTSQPVLTLLIERLEITKLHPNTVKFYAAKADSQTLSELIADREQLRQFVNERQLVDLIRQYPAQLTADELVQSLNKITPRLYSIASSQLENDDEVHLTLGVVEYDAFDQAHLGAASGFLSQRVALGQTVNVYVESNNNFRLPENEQTPIIMIGAGTGIAPYRAFLQHRDSQQASGQNWLFTGNQHVLDDFLYQSELLNYRRSGLLTKLNAAFSRDQEHKIYVQDLLIEQGEQVFDWLQQGAHVYVCGDAQRMAGDVHNALLTIIETYGGFNKEQASNYLDQLQQDHRYQKDVY